MGRISVLEVYPSDWKMQQILYVLVIYLLWRINKFVTFMMSVQSLCFSESARTIHVEKYVRNQFARLFFANIYEICKYTQSKDKTCEIF